MSVDLGPVTLLGADVIGQSDQRQFCLFAQSVRGSVLMWLEKEQLDGLSIALDRSLALITEGQALRTEAQVGGRSAPEGIPANFPHSPDYECQVGQMRLSFNEDDSAFQLNIVPIEIIIERGREPQVHLREEDTVLLIFTQQQAQQLSGSIGSVISAEDSICPLCRAPLDGQLHTCVKQNGHKEIIHIIRDEDEEE
jgi:uncharacterized repeat protein (TIGR03847 family)